MKNVVAISTPIGSGGISIVRITGDNAIEILEKLTKKEKSFFQPRRMELVKIHLDSVVEKGLCVFFKGPKSYTGENMVEIHCHGGVVITNKILRKCLDLGCSLAEEGEFSKRAFLNGKMTLDECEGVIDMINAESDLALRVGGDLMNGRLKEKVRELSDKLVDMSAKIEVALDYPEYDEETVLENEIKIELTVILKEVEKMIISAGSGKVVREGIDIALVGEPNVGKSSLLNALIDYEKAIVTDIAGTTRDTVEGSEVYKGIKFNYVDTAGIRKTDNIVEKIGVEKSQKLINDADLVLSVFTSEENIVSADDRNVIYVQNKSDLGKDKNSKADIFISALKKSSIDELKEIIYKKTIDESIISSGNMIVNERHLEILKRGYAAIESAIASLEMGEDLECLAFNINELYSSLGEIIGETTNEKVIDAIFRKFCLGK